MPSLKTFKVSNLPEPSLSLALCLSFPRVFFPSFPIIKQLLSTASSQTASSSPSFASHFSHQTFINPSDQSTFSTLNPVVKQRYQVNMLSLTFLFTSLLLSFVAAQNTTFNPSSIDLTTRSMLALFSSSLPLSSPLSLKPPMLTRSLDQWCQGEQTNCPTLCGGQAQTKDNTCVGVGSNLNPLHSSTLAASASPWPS